MIGVLMFLGLKGCMQKHVSMFAVSEFESSSLWLLWSTWSTSVVSEVRMMSQEKNREKKKEGK